MTLVIEGAWLRERLLQLLPRWPMLEEAIPLRGGRERASSCELSFVSELEREREGREGGREVGRESKQNPSKLLFASYLEPCRVFALRLFLNLFPLWPLCLLRWEEAPFS